MKHYAQLNDSNLCVGISTLTTALADANLVEIPAFDEDYLYRKYENGTWSAEKYEPVPADPQPTNAEIQANQLIIMDALATIYEDLLLKGVV